jgi:hypothetical protein
VPELLVELVLEALDVVVDVEELDVEALDVEELELLAPPPPALLVLDVEVPPEPPVPPLPPHA